jgi:hypothetical protein
VWLRPQPGPRSLRQSFGAEGSVPQSSPGSRKPSSARAKRWLDAAGTAPFAGALPRSADGDRTLDLLRTTETVATTTKEPICRDFQAADGTRTHDLLHGKKNLIRRCTPLCACKLALFRSRGARADTPRFGPIPGGSPNHFRMGLRWLGRLLTAQRVHGSTRRRDVDPWGKPWISSAGARLSCAPATDPGGRPMSDLGLDVGAVALAHALKLAATRRSRPTATARPPTASAQSPSEEQRQSAVAPPQS